MNAKRDFILACIFGGILVWMASCNSSPSEKNGTPDETSEIQNAAASSGYHSAIQEMRNGKNLTMVKNGIIKPDKQKDFKGLNYYEPDTGFIFKATLELLKPEKVIFKTSDIRPEYYKFCRLTFIKDGKTATLIGYVPNPQAPENIFVPFKDVTGNKETYGGGRYIDLKYAGEKTMILLDFNLAYNPYCHYNHDYSCPLVPQENVLEIPIFAGEKKLYD